MPNDYFTGERLFWDDPDFQSLEQKAVYAMLWQSITTDIAGIHSRNDMMDSCRVCLTIDAYKKILIELEGLEKIRVLQSKIWVKAAIWRNLGKGHCSDKQLIAVDNRLKDIADVSLLTEIISYYKKKYRVSLLAGYPIDTLSIPYSPVTVSDTDSVTDTESGEYSTALHDKTANVENSPEPASPDFNKKSDRDMEAPPPAPEPPDLPPDLPPDDPAPKRIEMSEKDRLTIKALRLKIEKRLGSITDEDIYLLLNGQNGYEGFGSAARLTFAVDHITNNPDNPVRKPVAILKAFLINPNNYLNDDDYDSWKRLRGS